MSKSITTLADDFVLPAEISAHLAGEYRLTTATAGDHLEIHRLLRQVMQQPSDDEFQSQLDEPTYEPVDRLLIKSGPQIIAHLRMVHRDIYYESATVPIVNFADVVTLPEHRQRGCATTLLAAAEHVAAADGAALGLLKTKQVEFYRKRGWHTCGARTATAASPLHLLSRLRETEPQAPLVREKERPQLHIRFWRHVEQAALMRLYHGTAAAKLGWWRRNADEWRWLISRRGFDRLYVAIEGSPRPELDDSFESILAYACERDGRIAELIGTPGRSDAIRRLLARICRDAIERDLSTLVLDAPEDDPWHDEMLAAAGGGYRLGDEPYAMMGKIFDRPGFVKQVSHVLCDRVATSGQPSDISLGLAVEDKSYLLRVGRRTAKLVPSRLLGRNYLSCSGDQFADLLLGQIDVSQSVAQGDLGCSTALAERTAAAIFPRRPLWLPPLEDMPAK
jgi:GNAT superfamily N-acetyltransferase